jgi:alpha-L-rhamnosidase
VTWSKLTKQTPHGEIALDWELNDGGLEIHTTIPSGTSALVAAPAGARQCSVNGRTRPIENGRVEVESGSHTIIFPDGAKQRSQI